MPDILENRSGHILELRLNRPDKKNAITLAMYAALADALAAAVEDRSVRVVTLTGAGDMFTSGNDLRDFQQQAPGEANRPVFRFLETIAAFPKVLVAGVHGAAVGVGTTMLLHCDLVIAAADATFSLPFVDLALVPEAGSSLLLPALIGRQRAAKHLILAEPFDAETALDYGLVAEIVPEGRLDERVRNIAGRVAAKPPEAVRITKALLRKDLETVRARIAEEGDYFGERLQSAEAAEAFRAFFERRQPDYSKFD